MTSNQELRILEICKGKSLREAQNMLNIAQHYTDIKRAYRVNKAYRKKQDV